MNRWSDKESHIFPKEINRKVNVIERLEFKLVYFEATVSEFSQYATGTHLKK